MAQKIDLPVRIFAPAKINLFLHVTDRDENGYHLLQSIICFTNIGDTVEIKKSNEFSFHIEGPFSSILTHDKKDENLVIKAVQILSRHVKRKPNLSITLHKSIPIGAGLGGGSADAAATIKGLLKFWQVKIEPQDLRQILIKLGADVPACYEDKACYVEGIGEILNPVHIPSTIPAILIYPNEFCSTKDIFENFNPPFTPPIEKRQDFSDIKNLYRFLTDQKNDLEPIAITKIPVIKEVIKMIEKQKGCQLARMSGSGSACFGLFDSEENSQRAVKTIQKEKPDWWVRPVIIG